MSQKDRDTLKDYFKSGDIPSGDEFSNLIDSCLNLNDDGISADGGKLGVGDSTKTPQSTLSVFGNVAISDDATDTPDTNGLYVQGNTGIGSGMQTPAAQLAVNGGMYIGTAANTDPGNSGKDTNLVVDGSVTAGNSLWTKGKAAIGTTTEQDGALYVDGTFKATGEVSLQSNLELLSNDTYIETSTLQSLNSEPLALTNNGNGLTIADSSGDVTADGNLILSSDKYIESSEIKARTSSNLYFYKHNQSNGLYISSSGDVIITKDLTLYGDLIIPNSKITYESHSETYSSGKGPIITWSTGINYIGNIVSIAGWTLTNDKDHLYYLEVNQNGTHWEVKAGVDGDSSGTLNLYYYVFNLKHNI